MGDPSINIPNYPGVERDVFNILRDYFTNLVSSFPPLVLNCAFVCFPILDTETIQLMI